MKQVIIGILSFFVLCLYWVGCASNIYQDSLTGTWGGEHIGMTIVDSSITLEYDCAHGTIDEPINPDEQGRFEVKGIHIIEHGGPVRSDEIPDKHPALYKGQIEESVMTLTVVLTDMEIVIGEFTLTHGEYPQIYKCL
ncbi:MAG: hypothetical protein O6940_04330 [Ignavibacteria bacterium]|nr:hypothetical protein [Ignavibacteria bacterium]